MASTSKVSRRRQRIQKAKTHTERKQKARHSTVTTIFREMGLVLGNADLIPQLEKLDRSRVTLKIDSDLEGDSEAGAVLNHLQRIIQHLAWEFPVIGSRATVNDYLMLVVPILDLLARERFNWNRGDPTHFNTLVHHIKTMRSAEGVHSFWQWFYDVLRTPLLEANRLETGTYYLECSTEKRHGRIREIMFTLKRQPYETQRFRTGEEVRWGYRCGHAGIGLDHAWADWNGRKMGAGFPKTILPVYVQDHALRRIYGPSGRLSSFGLGDSCLHESLWASLKTPVLRPLPPEQDTYLVEFRVGGVKLGYLVAQVFPQGVLVKTFLFLTMKGTPEGNHLHRLLKLHRADTHFLRLDDSATFQCTDLADDPILRQIFESCHCNHLFTFRSDASVVLKERAKEIRQYLRLDERSLSRLMAQVADFPELQPIRTCKLSS